MFINEDVKTLLSFTVATSAIRGFYPRNFLCLDPSNRELSSMNFVWNSILDCPILNSRTKSRIAPAPLGYQHPQCSMASTNPSRAMDLYIQILKWHFLWGPTNKNWSIFLKVIQMTEFQPHRVRAYFLLIYVLYLHSECTVLKVKWIICNSK